MNKIKSSERNDVKTLEEAIVNASQAVCDESCRIGNGKACLAKDAAARPSSVGVVAARLGLT